MPSKMKKPPLIASGLTICGLTVLCGLGTWQLQRLAWKNDLIQKLDQSFAKTPPHLEKGDLDKSLDLQRRQITGSYQGQQLQIQPRTHKGKPGYHVIASFRTQNNQELLVNRGWTPIDMKPLPSVPLTSITLTGLFKAPQADNIFVPQNQPQKNSWYRLDTKEMGEALKLNNTAPVIFYVEADTSKDNAYPVRIGKKPELKNNHAQYAFFWFSMACAMLMIFWLRFVKR